MEWAHLSPRAPPALRTAAVTGTNGKTSVAEFARQLLGHAGLESASLGTLGLVTGCGRDPRPVLPPGREVVSGFLDLLEGGGTDAVVMEAFSQNLDAGLLDGLGLDAAAFTNLDRDHLDYHGSYGAYFRAKRRLFERAVAPGGVAVLNAEAPQTDELRAVCLDRGVAVLPFGRGSDLRLLGHEPTASGTRVRVACFGAVVEAEVRVAGEFMLQNVLCAIGLCVALGADVRVALRSLPALQPPPGRMEPVALWNGARVYVDYAHTPAALAAALRAARERAAGRVHVVVGCGGDPGKRPLMGRAAARLADRVYVTDHTPTKVDAAAVRAAVLTACPGAQEVGGRGAAVRRALSALRPGDVLVIAGRGHESYLTARGKRTTDRAAVEAATQALTQGAPHSKDRRGTARRTPLTTP